MPVPFPQASEVLKLFLASSKAALEASYVLRKAAANAPVEVAPHTTRQPPSIIRLELSDSGSDMDC